MSFNYNNAAVVISSTVIASVTCVICIALPENDEDDNDVVREDTFIILEPDAIVVNVRDEDVIEIEQSAIQINDDLIRNLNTPQAIIVATVVPTQYY
jgi:hypothetical protein